MGTTEYRKPANDRPAGPQQHTHEIPTQTKRGPVTTKYTNKR